METVSHLGQLFKEQAILAKQCGCESPESNPLRPDELKGRRERARHNGLMYSAEDIQRLEDLWRLMYEELRVWQVVWGEYNRGKKKSEGEAKDTEVHRLWQEHRKLLQRCLTDLQIPLNTGEMLYRLEYPEPPTTFARDASRAALSSPAADAESPASPVMESLTHSLLDGSQKVPLTDRQGGIVDYSSSSVDSCSEAGEGDAVAEDAEHSDNDSASLFFGSELDHGPEPGRLSDLPSDGTYLTRSDELPLIERVDLHDVCCL